MRRAESSVGAEGLIEMLNQVPLWSDDSSTDKRGFELIGDSQANESIGESSQHKRPRLPRVPSANEVGRISIDSVLPLTGSDEWRLSGSAEVQARCPNALPVSMRLLSCPPSHATSPRHEPNYELAAAHNDAPSPFGMLALASDIELSPLLPSLPTGGGDIPGMQLPESSVEAAAAAQQLLDACADSGTFAPMYDRVSPRPQQPGFHHHDDHHHDYHHDHHHEPHYEPALYDEPQSYEPPPDSAESFLMNHARWQEQLQETLTHADGYTRSLLSAATMYHPCGTVEVLAGLSARQVHALHPPCRELVQTLLRRTLAQAALVIPSLAQIQMAY